MIRLLPNDRLLAALSAPVLFLMLAGATAVQAQAPSSVRSSDLSVTPRNGQSAEQQAADNRECQGWAHDQTGFDAQRADGGVAPADYGAKHSQYSRAMGACLEAHGYTVHYAPPGVPAPAQAYAPPPPPPPSYGGPYYERRARPALNWYPVHIHADAGYTVAAGDAGTNLNDGWNTGIGATFFPVETIPVGLRIDGSYSQFQASDHLLNVTNADFGHSNLYGGDTDLQVNVPFLWNQRFYVFGGIGWYREQTVLHQFSFDGGFCDYFFGCGVGTQQYTTSWHDAWNTGVGWEMALADHLSLFVEASYLRIRPYSDGQQFVPIRVGVRF